MSDYRTVSHLVTAQRIKKVEPLIISDKVLAPDQGIRLRFDDGTALKWMAEPNVPTPQVDDWVVSDSEFATTFVVSASKFESLFRAA